MAKYYYLISSLPMIKVGEPLPFSYEEFLAICKSEMSSSDYKELEKATFTSDDSAKSSLMKMWQQYLDKVGLILKDERAKNLKWNDAKILTEMSSDPVLKDRIHRAVTVMNPLEGEKEILNIYFDFLTSNSSLDPFSIENLMIYALKIQIIERMNAFSKEKGNNEFRRLFSRIQDQFE